MSERPEAWPVVLRNLLRQMRDEDPAEAARLAGDLQYWAHRLELAPTERGEIHEDVELLDDDLCRRLSALLRRGEEAFDPLGAWTWQAANLRARLSSEPLASAPAAAPSAAEPPGDATAVLTPGWPLRDVPEETIERRLLAHDRPVIASSLTGTGRHLVASDDVVISVWDLDSQAPPVLLTDERAGGGWRVAACPTGGYFASLHGRWLLASPDGPQVLRVWSVPEGELRWEHPLPGGAVGLSLFGDGGTVLVFSPGPDVLLLDAGDGHELGSFTCDRDSPVGFSTVGRWVAAADESGRVVIHDVPTGTPRRALAGRASELRRIQSAPDGSWLVTASESAVTAWWAADGRMLWSERRVGGWIDDVLVSDGDWVAAALDGREVRFLSPSASRRGWFPRRSRRIPLSPDRDETVRASCALLDVCRGGTAVVLVSNVQYRQRKSDRLGLQVVVSVWAPQTGDLLGSTLIGGEAEGAAVSADGRRLSVLGDDTLTVVELDSLRTVLSFPLGARTSRRSWAVDARRSRVAVALSDGPIVVVRPDQAMVPVDEDEFVPSELIECAPGPRGTLLVAALRRWAVLDARTGRTLRTMAGERNGVFLNAYFRTVTARADGAVVATVDDVGTVRVWNVLDGSVVGTGRGSDGEAFLEGDAGALWASTWTRSGDVNLRDERGRVRRTLAHAKEDGWSPHPAVALGEGLLALSWERERNRLIDVWNVADGTRVARLPQESALGVRRTRDGRHLELMGVTSDGDVHVTTFGPSGPLSGATIRGGEELATARMCLASSGRFVATGSPSGEVGLWDLGSGKWRSLPGAMTGRAPGRRSLALGFSPHDRYLAAAWDGLVRVWETDTREPVTAFRVLTSLTALCWPGPERLAVVGYHGSYLFDLVTVPKASLPLA